MNFTFTATIIILLSTVVGLKKRDSIRPKEKSNRGEQGHLLIITCPLKAELVGSTLVFADKDPVFSRVFNLSKRSDIFVRRASSGGWKV